MIGKYFDLLGLPSTATEDDVKKRYRELVKLVHPDVNSSEDAHHQFVVITDAYNALLQYFENQENSLEITFEEVKVEESSVEDDWVTYRKHAAEQYKIRKEKEKKDHANWFLSLRMGWRKTHMNIAFFITFLVLIATVADWILPYREVPEVAKSYSLRIFNSIPPNKVSLLQTQSGMNLWVANYNPSYFSNHPFFHIKCTYILHQPISIRYHYWSQFFEIPIHFTVYWAQLILLPVIVIPLVAFLYKKDDAMFTFLNFFARFISLPLVLLMLFTDDRWLHLVSLGFI